MQVIDDLTFQFLDEDQAETVEFGIDGQMYSIDLSLEGAAGLRGLIERYVVSAREISSSPRTPLSPRLALTDPKVIREWAQQNGFDVAGRGRLPDGVKEAYDAAPEDLGA